MRVNLKDDTITTIKTDIDIQPEYYSDSGTYWNGTEDTYIIIQLESGRKLTFVEQWNPSGATTAIINFLLENNLSELTVQEFIERLEDATPYGFHQTEDIYE